jgi:bifunctional enzyme CysN/CysC
MSQAADQFQVAIHWQSAQPLLAGRRYGLVYGENKVLAQVTAIKNRQPAGAEATQSAKSIHANDRALVNISLAEVLDLRPGDSFTLEDLLTGACLGQGLCEFALFRSANIRWQPLSITKAARAEAKAQRARCIWFTGLSGSGKSTIANLLEQQLFARGLHSYLLDGDNLRHGLNRDLGFTPADRVENIRRAAEVAHLMVDAGLIVLASFITPFSAERAMVRKLFLPDEFIEVYVDTPLAECEARDLKGLYAKARRGELRNFTGIDSPYEVPSAPDLRISTSTSTAQQAVEQILALLQLP